MRFFLLLAAVCFAFSSAFAQYTVVDSILYGKEYKLPPLDSTYRTKATIAKTTKSEAQSPVAGKVTEYSLQFDAIADFDAAQARRVDLQRRTGFAIQLVFDSPFYKLRAGSWSKKEDAEDQARQLAEVNVQAFVVRIVR